jgi:cellulose synthase/poly-beta-1,6-N-acetylglucosamine synthase-like glycosyltransferase
MPFLLMLSTGIYLAFILFIIVGLFRHNEQAIISTDQTPTVSVVIAARNEEKNLPDLIQDLLHQEYPLEQLEVIIVDDRSTDFTAKILREAAENYAVVKYIRVEQLPTGMTPKKHALTQGIEMAKGDVILSTDADCRVGKFWVSSMAYSVVQQDGISIGYSKVAGESFFERFQMLDFLGIITTNAGAGGWGHFWSGTGQNLAYKKSDFEAIGGFESVKDKISGDDMYLVQSISKLKTGMINIDANSFVTTAAMPTFPDFINQRIRWSSNSKDNAMKSHLFFAFLSSAFLCNATLLLSFLFGHSWLYLFLLKFIFEGSAVMLGGKLFNTKVNPIVYVAWALAQPIYIPVVGLMGLQNRYTWKT